MDSAWCRHEIDEARAYGIPIICVVDADKQTQREVIDCYMEKGFGWLFDAQASCFFSLLICTRLIFHTLERSYLSLLKIEMLALI